MNPIEKEIRKKADKSVAENSKRFFKTGKGEYAEGDKFLGVTVPDLRRIAKKHHHLDLDTIKESLTSEFHEIRLCGFILLVNQYEKTKNDTVLDRLYKTYVGNFRYLNNWDLVDVTCYKIVGPHLENSDRKDLYKWARSKNLWERRVAIISTFYYIKKNDLNDAYKISEILLNDEHDLMHKAVGWMLRECGKKDQERLEKFILKHVKEMPRTMLRYAIEKFPEARRKQILKL